MLATRTLQLAAVARPASATALVVLLIVARPTLDAFLIAARTIPVAFLFEARTALAAFLL